MQRAEGQTIIQIERKGKTKGLTCLRLAWENIGFTYMPYSTLYTLSFLSTVFILMECKS